MTVTINGAERLLPHPLTVDGLLAQLQLRRELVAVELNREIVRKGDYADRQLAAGDRIEIVEFVGGG